jgi:hypothetical protein
MSDFWMSFMRIAGVFFAFGSFLLFLNATSNLPIILRGCNISTQKIEDDFLDRLIKDVSSKLNKGKVATDQIVRLMNFSAILLAYDYDIYDLQSKLAKQLNKKVCLEYKADYPFSSMLAARKSGTEEWSGILSMTIDNDKPVTIKIW